MVLKNIGKEVYILPKYLTNVDSIMSRSRAILLILLCFISVQSDLNIQPQRADIDIGDEVTLTCISAGFTKWFFKREQLPNNAVISGAYGNILTIKKATLANFGYYACYGKLVEESGYFIARTLILVHSELMNFPFHYTFSTVNSKNNIIVS